MQPPPTPPTRPCLGLLCKYCILGSFIIWDMALSLRVGQNLLVLAFLSLFLLFSLVFTKEFEYFLS